MPETKTAVVTGASRGIGHAVAQRFRDQGWRVITVSREPPPDRCPWSDGGNTHISLDLSDLKQIVHTVEQLRPLLSGAKLHALINNAGISPKGPGAIFVTIVRYPRGSSISARFVSPDRLPGFQPSPVIFIEPDMGSVVILFPPSRPPWLGRHRNL
jgi:NAD(P)-dependent dehydrogenase (short-subunit alcohol dehydrogenase family)